jgi:putative ABC transport system substrate-binding protein
VRLNVEVIVTPPTAAALAAQKATRSIPIVMIFVAEPVGLGLVQSLARPAGNITGTTLWAGWEIFRKQLQLLKEAAPRIGRVAVLWNPANRPAHHLVLRSVETAAQSMNIELQPQGAQGPEEFDSAFAAMKQGHAGALLVISDLVYFPHRARLTELAIKSRLPTMFAFRWDVEAGGLKGLQHGLGIGRRSAVRLADGFDVVLRHGVDEIAHAGHGVLGAGPPTRRISRPPWLEAGLICTARHAC